ncbi:MAG: VOC family protein [Burkholderiaceae bacterium]|nr:VOC family protein [Burkholderiaceae bacterium]
MLTASTTPPALGKANPGLTPVMLNHAAWVTHDVAKTADFYTRIMGMELASTVIDDKVPSTGDDIPYFHIFFRMQDGSTLAFFEAPGVPLPSKSSHLAYDIFNHIALQANSREDVLRWYDWLVANGIEVVGPTDHGIILSIYFHDPSGLRLEITTPLDPEWNKHTVRGYSELAQWVAVKEKAQREGADVPKALLVFVKEMRALRNKAKAAKQAAAA